MSNVSCETLIMLQQYAALIRKWNGTINLMSRHDIKHLEARHIKDSEQVGELSFSPRNWVDLGSGGGLPGVVIAMTKPQTEVNLVEADKRKCAFLRTVKRDLGLENLNIENTRIEAFPSQNADIVSARALAPLDQLLEYVHRHLAKSGTALLMKGNNWRTEVEKARKLWHFDCQAIVSDTNPASAILKVQNIHHA